jgi:hypothetical protein
MCEENRMTENWKEYFDQHTRERDNQDRADAPAQSPLTTHYWVSTLMIFVRLAAPVFIVTADFAHLNLVATSAMSSSLALPSTGGDLSLATHVPSAD